MPTKSLVSKITIGRLFNLGNYEHVRYEVSVDVHPSESPSMILLGLEKAVNAMRPISNVPSIEDISALKLELQRISGLSEEAWKKEMGWRYSGKNKEEVLQHEKERLREMEQQYHKAKTQHDVARSLLDDLGATALRKDCKPDWNDDEEF